MRNACVKVATWYNPTWVSTQEGAPALIRLTEVPLRHQMRPKQKCWLPLLLSGILFSFSCTHRRMTAPTPWSPLARATADSGRDENEAGKRRAPWDPPDDPQARRAWFQARKRSAANLRRLQTMLGTALPAATPASTSTNPFQWTSIGPQPIVNANNPYAGSVLTLAMDPHNTCVVYAGTYVGKLWKTADCGNTWQPLSDSGPLVQITSISVDPVLANTVYILDAGSIYKSSDAGVTWTELPPVITPFPVAKNLADCYGTAFAIHPSVSGTWLIAEYCPNPQTPGSYAAIYRSTDGGSTWAEVQNSLAGSLEYEQIGFNGGNGSFAYASGITTSYTTVFQTSSDSGVTWTSALGSGPNSASLNAPAGDSYVLFAAAPSAPGTVYLLVHSYSPSSMVLQLFKTIDQGITWTALTAFPSDIQYPRPPGLVAVSPTNPNMVFAGAVVLYGSVDGGQKWQPAVGTAPGVQLHADNHAMIFSPDGTRLYEANDGGVWTMQTASSAGWVNLNASFGTAEFYYGIGIDPANIARAFGGTQDNSTLQYTGSLGWTLAGVCGDGLGAAINPTSPNIVYAACNGGFFKSVTGGAPGTWTSAQNGLPAAMTVGPIFTMDSTSPDVLYVYRPPNTERGFTVFQSLDGANSWHQIGPTFQNAVAAVAVAPSNSNTVVAADDKGNLSITTKALSGSASIWVSHSAPSGFEGVPGLFLPAVTAITIHPQNPNEIWLLGRSSLFESLDGAVTWQPKSLANVTGVLAGLVVDPDVPNTLYLSTDSAVFRSSDGGASWYPLASGFPFVNVSSVTLHHASRTLRAGTGGRGAWDLAVPTTAPRVSNVSVAPAVPGPGVVLTVTGINFVSNSVAWMNGSPLASSFINSTQMTATVPPGSSLNATGNLIAVYTPGNAGGLSDPVSVIIPAQPIFSTGTLGVSSAHTGSFLQGQSTGAYTILIQNGGSAATSGAVSVTDTLPAGLTATAINGPGWACALATLTCTRSDVLAAGGNYPPIAVMISVASNAPLQVTNQVSVSGGGSATATASDPTTVLAAFADVSPTDLFLPAIDLLMEYGITSGCGASPPLYCSTANITEGQMAVFVVRSVMGGDNFAYTQTPYFSDVPATYQFFPWIQKMQDLGIALPCAPNQFCPETPVTRGIMAVLIIRGRYDVSTPSNYPATPYFSDVPLTHPYFPWIQKMEQLGITSGCAPSSYCPNDPVTRGQMAVFIMRGEFNQLLPATTPVVVWAFPASISPGQTAVVTILGQNTNFSSGVTQVNAGAGITVSNISVTNPTTLTAQLAVASGVTLGPRSITITTGGEEATLPNGLHVQ
jgi:photosystem II stability/assembly factor-like uncharacterized protein